MLQSAADLETAGLTSPRDFSAIPSLWSNGSFQARKDWRQHGMRAEVEVRLPHIAGRAKSISRQGRFVFHRLLSTGVKNAQSFCVRTESPLAHEPQPVRHWFAAANFHRAPCEGGGEEYPSPLSLMDRAIRPRMRSTRQRMVLRRTSSALEIQPAGERAPRGCSALALVASK